VGDGDHNQDDAEPEQLGARWRSVCVCAGNGSRG
jgi:hypothetical protein